MLTAELLENVSESAWPPEVPPNCRTDCRGFALFSVLTAHALRACIGTCRSKLSLSVSVLLLTMGGKPVKMLPKSTLLRLSESTRFDIGTIQRMHVAFNYISSSVKDDGIIDPEEFQLALGFSSLKFCQRIFQLIDGDGDMKIDFNEFVSSMSILVSLNEVDERERDDLIEEKLKFSFQVYDEDKDDKISTAELARALQDVMDSRGIFISDRDLAYVVRATFAQASVEQEDVITYDEYKRLVVNNPASLATFLQAYSVDVDASLQNAVALHKVKTASAASLKK